MSRSLLQHLVGDAEFEALFTDEAEIAAILQVRGGAGGGRSRCGLISDAAAEAIATAIAVFTPRHGRSGAGASRGTASWSLRWCGNCAPASANMAAALHLGATSQDAIDTGADAAHSLQRDRC